MGTDATGRSGVHDGGTMQDLYDARFWVSVKFNVPDQRYLEEFHSWYDGHVRRLVAGAGYAHGWRTEEVDLPPFGSREQRYWAMVTFDELARFAPPPASSTPVASGGQRYGAILDHASDHGRVFYRILGAVEDGRGSGHYLAREEFNLLGLDGDEGFFERRVRQEHLERLLERPGVHRAWQLRAVHSELQIGPDPVAPYLNVYECDAPGVLVDGGLRPLGSFAPPLAGEVVVRRIQFARLLLDVAHE
jgi:hypothetical protein